MIASLPESPAQRNKVEIERKKWEEISLHDFVREFWSVIEPGKRFVDGWHIQAICLHLEVVTEGKIRRLLVNMPPRHAKSTIISVFWPVWWWIKNPSLRFLCASYALNLATRDNVKARRLILSTKFQARYGYLFRLTKDQNAKMKFETDPLGYRMAVSVGSSATGEGGDALILDDPHSIEDRESDVKRRTALDWFDNTWSSRLNDPQTSVMVCVSQRVHEQDVSGHILEGNAFGEWVHLNLPAEYDPATPCRTYLPSGEELWADPRIEEGQLLWEARFPRAVIERAKQQHGVLGYSALYGQRPIPPGGYTFNTANERLYTLSPEGDTYLLQTPGGIRPLSMYQCWLLTTSDVAVTDKETSAYTVFATWAVTPEHDVLLLDVVRGHWDIPTQKKHGRLAYRKWACDRYRALYFEDVGYQSAIGQDLLTEGIPCLPFHPQGKGDKVMRAAGASIWQEAGKVYFPAYAPWLEDWRKEIYTFPMSDKADQVDTLSMVCMLVRTPEIEALDEETAAAISNWQGY